MLRRAMIVLRCVWGCMVILLCDRAGAEATVVPAAVVCARDASFAEKLAAKEIRRYVYLRTGRLLTIEDRLSAVKGGVILVGSKASPIVRDAGLMVDDLGPEQYLLTTSTWHDRPIIVVAGGDPIGTLYGAYRLAERLGVRFYLHGDVIPDQTIALGFAPFREVGKPLFDRRGVQPFHDFPEGPDWWNLDAYKAYLGQLPKLRMNFFGLHTYPEGGVGPEPATWIGPGDQIGEGGRVKASYPARHFTAANGTWGYNATKTGDYTHGTSALFDRDDFGADYMKGMTPWPETAAAQNELFFRMGGLLNDAFAYAHRLGVKTCLGTETRLVIPSPVKARLRQAGKNPDDPAVVQELYEGIFRRIAGTHPLDYYWFWTPEGWTWSAVTQPQIDATLADIRAAIAAHRKVQPPFTLATCGWVLGPPQQPALFDGFLPREMPMSCINRQVGHEPVEPGFARVVGRPKWAIPWLEDDPALTSVQLWAGRMRKDAVDALAYGCTGLVGIHWRTRVLGPNVAALAAAAWDQSWTSAANRSETKAPPEGPVGGLFARFDAPMTGTTMPELYQTVRYNTRGYHLDMPAGAYTVTLRFVEPAYDRPGVRVFGVSLQGKPVIESLDIFARAGRNKALDFTFKDVAVTDGRLKIDFNYQVEFPCIAAIAVEGPAGRRKINCGGGACQDYIADWPEGPEGGSARFLPADDFYADWALAQFGPEVAPQAAAIFTRIDGHLPRPTDWTSGPGGIKPESRPWDAIRKDYAFIDDLEALRSQVRGAGNLDRFDYWLESFQYMRSAARAACDWHRFNEAMIKVMAGKTTEERKALARALALPVRREVLAAVADLHRHLLATVSTPGELGTVANWQQHNMPDLVFKPGQELASALGGNLPADAVPSKDSQGPPRIFVPVVRTGLISGEPLTLTVNVLGARPSRGFVSWRKLGERDSAYSEVPLTHVARGVWTVTFPPEATRSDFEYFVQVDTELGQTLHFPATAPGLNQTVLVVDSGRT